MLKEKTTHKIVLSDLKAVFYKISHETNEELGEKRFLDYDTAQSVANEKGGKVVRVTKRMLETMEFETTN